MGFCGCSLHASTVSAGIYGLIFSIYGITWTAIIIRKMNSYFEYLLISYNSIVALDNVLFLRNDKAVYGLVIFALVLHVVWFLSSIFVLIGNDRKSPQLLHCWVIITSIILIADFASTIYTLIRPSSVCGFFNINPSYAISGFCFGYLLVASLFNKFGFITMGIEIALVIYVSSRAKEIVNQQRTPTQIIMHSPQYLPGQGTTVHTYATGNQMVQVSNFESTSHGALPPWNEPAPSYSKQGINKIDYPGSRY